MTILIDKRNWDEQAPILKEFIRSAEFIGLDVETHDADRHEGLNARCKYREDGSKPVNSKLIFDFRRMTLCGVSFYTEAMKQPFYLNVGHADEENRLTLDQLREIMAVKPEGANWIAHNAPYEICVFQSCVGLWLPPSIICTLQMAVSAYQPDQYDKDRFMMANLGGMSRLISRMEFIAGDLFDVDTNRPKGELEEILFKIIAKESDSAHSYNGFVSELAFGYGLKDAVKSHFNVTMQTFTETLGDEVHMGKLTGEQVAQYGGDDAYWAVKLFRRLLIFMMQNGGRPVVDCFFQTENPMTHVFAELRLGGLKVDREAIDRRQVTEQGEAGKTLRRLRAAVRKKLPFGPMMNPELAAIEAWYTKNHAKYRHQLVKWAELEDADDHTELSRVNGSVSKSLGYEKGTGPNITYWMTVRVILYDLIGLKPLVIFGKVQSDGEARGRLRDKCDEVGAEIIDCLTALAGIEQRMKLYITPYRQLIDPETERMYPSVSSMLATRRMAASEPNSMQLAKRGESTYVRGFFEADEAEHVMISLDWSAIELVEIGEFSGDPEFIKAFGQTPHEDLHSGAAADILRVEVPELNVDIFKSLRGLEDWSSLSGMGNLDRLSHNLKGEVLAPPGAYKYWRTEVGKGANFNYWYSGFLSTIGERMGWSPDKTAAATELYKQRFAAAEQWRLDTIALVARDGFITMPDGQRYTRFEATDDWFRMFTDKFVHEPRDPFMSSYYAAIRWMAGKLRKRAGNQTVNALIQGTCATIAKRSILRLNKAFKDLGWDRKDVRFMMPVHDELVFSVHRSLAVPFIRLAHGIMTGHPDLFTKCQLDASPSVGLTFEPWNSKKAPLGQIELFELPKDIFGAERENKRATDDEINQAVEWLFNHRR